MENQGYEDECPSGNGPIRSSHDQITPSTREVAKSAPITRHVAEETHVYEDIAPSPERPNVTEAPPASSRFPIVREASSIANAPCPELVPVDPADSIYWTRNNIRRVPNDRDDATIEPGQNFHRNLTLPLRAPILGGHAIADRVNRYSVRVTNRERTRNASSKCFQDRREIDENTYDLEKEEDRRENVGRGIDRLVDKPGGRRRRKKDCKRCAKGKTTNLVTRDDYDLAPIDRHASITIRTIDTTSRIVRANNSGFDVSDDKAELESVVVLADSIVNVRDEQQYSRRHANRSQICPRIPETRRNGIFAITNNVNSVTGSPKPLNYDKNETDLLRINELEVNDDRALITPQKNRNGMKVNSIYSQDNWRAKDLPIFVTDVKEQNFQRAYSLPTRTHTPTSQNRANLRRSVRGEPPPHPARLRKNRHGWTLHLARPLDAASCTRSIVLLLIAVLALLGIGAIALYIVFEPEKLQIIQQYLRSSTPNATSEKTNSTYAIDDVDPYDGTRVDTTISATFTTLRSTSRLQEEVATTLTVTPKIEVSTKIAATIGSTIVSTIAIVSTTPSARNDTRYCDDCYTGEVCVALVDEDVPVCRVGPDITDPTGCNGLCLINKQKCHRLDFDAYRCVEVEHYCLDDEWTCANTLCIPLVKQCDGHMNCYDHSDEYDCVCDLQTHFQCGNETSCLPLERRCDGKIDCWDATDEMNCTLACPSSSEFTCSNGECILKARFCDGLRDCTDGSDEPHGCQGRCNKHEFSCLNGRCITKGTKCNGIDDCGDGSDEQHCRDRIYKKITA